jgi:hypothetical protein
LRRLVSGEFDAALFTGNEIDTVSAFSNRNLIAAANLNRLINNFYNQHMFPRAVFAAFGEDLADSEKLGLLDRFVNAYNDYAGEQEARIWDDIKKKQRQFFSKTGPEADLDDVVTLVSFTKDYRTAGFLVDRREEEEDSDGIKGRALEFSDFHWFDRVSYQKRLSDTIDALGRSEVREAFDLFLDASPKLVADLEKIRNAIVEEARSRQIRAKGEWDCEELKSLCHAHDLLEGDMKLTLELFVQKLWDEWSSPR